MHHKNEFINYCENRGFEVIGEPTEGPAGVSGVIEVKRPIPINEIVGCFTTAIIHDRQDKTKFSVRLSYKDFHNEAITGGLIEPDCNHTDGRICEGLGH